MKKILMIISTAVLMLSSVWVISAEMAFDESKSVVLQEENKQFAEVMAPISFADAFGSRETGPHGTFGQFPGNFETPVHTHSYAYHAIVVKGEMTNPFADEENPPVMTAGSYWYVAAGEAHSTACVSETPCEFYMHADKGFDFAPVE